MAVQAPINYGIDVAPLNPAQQIMQGMAVGQGLLDAREQGLQRQQAAEMRPLQMQQAQLAVRTGLAAEADANAARALAEAAQKSQAIAAAEKAAARQKLASEPLSVDALQRFTILYPEESKALEESMKRLSTEERRQFVSDAGQARAALESGNQEAAVSFLQGRAQARREAGDIERADAMKRFAEQAQQNPVLARNMLAAFIASDDPEKFAENETKLLTQAGTVREGEAKADIERTNADMRVKEIESKLKLERAQASKYYADIQNDAKRLDLDERRLAAESEARLADMEFKASEIPANLVPSVLKMSDESVADSMVADQWQQVADGFRKFETSYVPGSGLVMSGSVATGVPGRVAEIAKGVLGIEDAIGTLRRRYKGLMASNVVNNLPPGAASDKDIEMAKGGFPSDVNDPVKLAEFSEAMARVQRAASRVKAARAEYISRNKSPGDARGSFMVGGIQVQPGQSQAEVINKIFAAQSYTE